jgi:hypothetical protein
VTIYLVKGYLDLAATTLADAQALLTALAEPADADNAAIIDKVTGKLETLVQSDSGEPLIISSIDDAAGTISSWVTDASTLLAIGLGDPDPNQGFAYASTTSFAISGNTRTGTLALNTTALTTRLAGNTTSRGIIAGLSAHSSSRYTLHLRKTSAAGSTETLALLTVRVLPGVLSATVENPTPAESYPTTTQFEAGAVHPAASITSLTGGGATSLDGQETGTVAAPTLPTGYTFLLSIGRVGQLWQLIAATDAEDVSAGIVRPDDYHASTNARIWVLL